MTARLRIEPGGLASLKKISRLPIKCKKRRHLIKNLDGKLIRKLSEVTHNIIKGNLKVSPHKLRKLIKHKKALKKFKAKSLALSKKKNILQRGAGFLGPLLSVALPILQTLLR